MTHFWKYIVLLYLVNLPVSAQEVSGVDFLSTFELPGVSIRAIEVLNENTLWFAGSSGRYGRVVKGQLEIDSISHEGIYPAFRSIAYNGNHIFLLSIESPALLYKIDPSKPLGQHELVYREDDPGAFYDSMRFFDQNHGLAVGDPTEGCLSVLKTTDGGHHWTKISCDRMPDIFEGEAAFAASNSNIATFEQTAWLVTGGSRARVFRTEDLGDTWMVSDTPIVQGGKMTGIFTTDFFDGQNGIIMGGDWENKQYNQNSKAITRDGGKSWELIATNQLPGYISCAQYRPNGSGHQLMAVSTEGIYYSGDSGNTWIKVDNSGFYSMRFIDSQQAWLCTHEKIVKIKLK